MNSLLQSVQQATPIITPPSQVIQQVQPTPTINMSTDKEKIKEEIKPINPVIKEPMEQYVPHPQTDQSHPLVTPELIIDSNISTPIHNKHMQHKQNIKEITPRFLKKLNNLK